MSNEIPLETLLKENKISQRTFDKTKVAKDYIERKYNLKTIKNIEWNAILEKLNSLNIPDDQKKVVRSEIFQKDKERYRKQREKMSIKDYESLSIIGRGAFGEVHVCRDKNTNEIVAIKKIKKEVLSQKNQILHTRNEQMFLSNVKSEWFVELKASFQEDDYLYLVMEYLPGGDLMNLFIKKDILTESEARFYIAEMILSIEEIHKYDCIHRDIKPDNVLIDKNGHIKISDFGLAKISEKIFINQDEITEPKPNENQKMTHKKNYSCVGTAYYVAPEVLNKKGYDFEIDWWSVGVIFYEMLVGYAPFCSKETSEVCYKIINWSKYLKIPSKIKMSFEAEDLIRKLVNNPNVRLGKKGAEEIKTHPFFKDFPWSKVHSMKAPFVPKLAYEYDVSYFETFQEKEPFYPLSLNENKRKRKDIEYLGYTYKEGNENNCKTNYSSIIETIENLKVNTERISNNTNENTEDIISSETSQKNTSDKSDLSQGSTNKKLQIIPLPSKKIKIDCSSRNTSKGKTERETTKLKTISNRRSKNTYYSPSPIKINYINGSFKNKSLCSNKSITNVSKDKIIITTKLKTPQFTPTLKNSVSSKYLIKKPMIDLKLNPNLPNYTSTNTNGNKSPKGSTGGNSNNYARKYKSKITFLPK